MKTAIALSCLVFVLTACNSATPTPAATAALSPVPVRQSSATFTKDPREATGQQPYPTSTARPTRTPTKEPAAIFTPAPTSTPLSTLSQAEADQMLADLLTTNGRCQLPCWWGIAPGESHWQDAWNLLSRYDASIYTKGTPGQDRFMEASILLPETSEFGGELRTMVSASNETIQTIDVHGVFSMPSYHLTSILSQYGQPDEIWIGTYQSYPSHDVPFAMILFYKRGILASYATLTKAIQGDYIQGCLPGIARLSLWNPVEETSFQKSAALFGLDVSDGAYLPLEQASDLSVEKFYQIYQGTNKVPCVKTPVKLWP